MRAHTRSRSRAHKPKPFSSLGEVSKKKKTFYSLRTFLQVAGRITQMCYALFEVSLASSGETWLRLEREARGRVCESDNGAIGSAALVRLSCRSMRGTCRAQSHGFSVNEGRAKCRPFQYTSPPRHRLTPPRVAIRERSQPIRASVTVK